MLNASKLDQVQISSVSIHVGLNLKVELGQWLCSVQPPK